MAKNAIGREIPEVTDGRKNKPFMGIGNYIPQGRKVGPPIPSGSRYKNKVMTDLDATLDRINLFNGMTISFHHHLRNGDILINTILEKLEARGLKDIVLAPSALFPVHEPIVEKIKKGVVSHVLGSMNGPIGKLCSTGGMKKTAILRSHGGRYRAIQDGDLKIDAAFIAAPTADVHGNANGVLGPSACGPLGFALADSLYADQVVVVTDNLVPFPTWPWSIEGGNVDFIAPIASLGDPEKIVSGTTRVTTEPDRLKIAAMAAQLVRDSGLIDEEAFSFQAGAGGMSLAFIQYVAEYMREKNVVADFVRGGSTEVLVQMLESGMTKFILDGQSFDLAGVRSLRDNWNHIETNPFVSYNYHTKGCFAPRVKASVLGATEIDLDFNVNVNTHSDGWLLHGIGGFQDAADAYMTIITAPLYRKTNPIVVERVHTVTAPGETIDVLVTDHGIAINPKRTDLLDRLKSSDLPIVSIEALREKAIGFTGKPQPARTKDNVVALIEWRDGTIIDTVREIDLA
ncbi:MAG: citrate lyase subunit alpha [Calditrichales bacterium]|nr:MAG: citrate lyase subunit alpha [Calditrichales bacterium]